MLYQIRENHKHWNTVLNKRDPHALGACGYLLFDTVFQCLWISLIWYGIPVLVGLSYMIRYSSACGSLLFDTVFQYLWISPIWYGIPVRVTVSNKRTTSTGIPYQIRETHKHWNTVSNKRDPQALEYRIKQEISTSTGIPYQIIWYSIPVLVVLSYLIRYSTACVSLLFDTVFQCL
jgi:hypothetical protein